jgi:hypothetical protein
MRIVLSPFLVVLAFTTSVAGLGCGSEQPSGDTAESVSDLRTLAPTEIVGTLDFGTTATVAYTETPRYRAFRVDAKAGDTIDAWVRGAGGADAKAWILAADYQTLTSNDDADATTTDAHVVTDASKDGAYFIVLRDKNLEDGTFTVTLAPRSPPAPPPPPSPPSPSWRAGLPTGAISIEITVPLSCSNWNSLSSSTSGSVETILLAGTNPGALAVNINWNGTPVSLPVNDDGGWGIETPNAHGASSMSGTFSAGQATLDYSSVWTSPSAGFSCSGSTSLP